jgi:D-alanyl-D-alanine carboxypeptidase
MSSIAPVPAKTEFISAAAPPKPKAGEACVLTAPQDPVLVPKLPVKAKAMFCLDCSSNKVVLAKNTSEPLPIASITKLLTAMIVIDDMKLDAVLEVPDDIKKVERHVVGLRAGDLLTVSDLLHGMLIESGNDCAEVLARGYPKGGRAGFIAAMNRRAAKIGAAQTTIYTPSGLDMKFLLGRKDGRSLASRKPNTATAQEVAVIAMEAFKYTLIREISSMKTYTMRTHNQPARNYPLASNDRLLHRNLPVAGAKTGYTGMAGKCIVALFKDQKSDYIVVVLNTAHHFKAAEKIYRWACKAL